MNKKINLTWLLSLFLSIVALSTLTACDDDDEPKEEKITIFSYSLVGTWTPDTPTEGQYNTLYFRGDGVGLYEYGPVNSDNKPLQAFFTWEFNDLENQIVTIHMPANVTSQTEAKIYRLITAALKLDYMDNTYTRTSYNMPNELKNYGKGAK